MWCVAVVVVTGEHWRFGGNCLMEAGVLLSCCVLCVVTALNVWLEALWCCCSVVCGVLLWWLGPACTVFSFYLKVSFVVLTV